MDKKAQQAMAIGTFVILFIGIIIAIALLPSIANSQNLITEKQTVTNETLDITSARINDTDVNSSVVFDVGKYAEIREGWQDQGDCPMTGFAMINESGTAMTSGTDYVISGSGGNLTLRSEIGIVNGSIGSNTTYITYSYCDDGYATSGATRSIAEFIMIFAALGLLGFAVYLGLNKAGLFK